MDYKELANLIFPDAKPISYYEEKYPERKLEEGAIVTRFAPSPTGVMHIGGLYQGLIAKKLAEQTQGVFFLRIEDTDQKREVENGIKGIVESLKDFDIEPDEGMTSETEEKGEYGPYKQSLRKEIYQAYAKYLSISMFLFTRRIKSNKRKTRSSKDKTWILWNMGQV